MAATFDGSITPPPPSGIRTPPTPRLGYHDNWEPFTPRKSARISSQRARTPSPHSAHRQQPRSPRTVKKSSKQASSSAVSPMPSPQKKRQPALDSVRRASGSLSVEGSQAASALGIKHASTQRPANSSVARASGMLPTPSKTPQKPPNEKTAANIKSIARNLFPSESEVMPSPKRRRAKKYTGISMESFTAEEIEEPIEIFTDSQDRVPSRDESESNPFFGEVAAPPEPTKRRSKRRHVNIPGEGVQSVDEASCREDGMIYVFRGKKFFRKFSDFDSEDWDELEDDADEESRLARPLTRSSIKPRLLFQTEKTQAMIDEEEAATDIEEQEEVEEEEPVAEIPEAVEVPEPPKTPAKTRQQRASTPEAPKYAPVSPPDTRRTTRSTNKLAEQPTPVKGRGRRSPFDSWPRTKEHKAASAPKRHGESLTPSHAKRTRT